MNDIYKYQHKFIGSSSVNIDDIIIRKYLNIKFIVDNIKNISKYKSFFFINNLDIVVNYKISLNKYDIIIPIISVKDVKNKILFNREYMIKRNYKKKIWKYNRIINIIKILNNIFPEDLCKHITKF